MYVQTFQRNALSSWNININDVWDKNQIKGTNVMLINETYDSPLSSGECISTLKRSLVWWFIKCLFKRLLRVNDAPHAEHLNGFSPPWTTIKCLFKSFLRLYETSHSVHLNGRCPVCTSKCLSRWLLCVYDVLHSVHLNGFSSSWTTMWFFNWLLSSHDSPQSMHKNSFSPVWNRTCLFSWELFKNRNPHCRHSKRFALPSRWISWCRFKSLLRAKGDEHTLHLKRLPPRWISLWALSVASCEKSESHSLHLYGRSPVCLRRWMFRVPDCVNSALQNSHLNGLIPLWIRRWRFKLHLWLKTASHRVHVNVFDFFSPVFFFLVDWTESLCVLLSSSDSASELIALIWNSSSSIRGWFLLRQTKLPLPLTFYLKKNCFYLHSLLKFLHWLKRNIWNTYELFLYMKYYGRGQNFIWKTVFTTYYFEPCCTLCLFKVADYILVVNICL